MSGVAVLFAAHGVSAIALTAVRYGAEWIGLYAVASVALGALVFLGTTQVFYAVPIALWLQRRRRFNALKGVAFGAVTTIVLNIAAFFYLVRLANSAA